MTMSKRNKWIAAIVALVLLVGLAGVLIEKKIHPYANISGQIAKELPESFTFFDMGANTRFNSAVRSTLGDHLGSDAITYRSQIDLTVNDPDFLKTYFPELHTLNLQLNFPPRERIEHDSIKLMYRYARKTGVPFIYVELLFSGYSHRPLVFSMNISHEGGNIIETLYQKYGRPEDIQGLAPPLRAAFWKKNNDVLLITTKSDRYGNPEYHIMIYYVNSLEELLHIEKEEARQRGERLKKASEKAF